METSKDERGAVLVAMDLGKGIKVWWDNKDKYLLSLQITTLSLLSYTWTHTGAMLAEYIRPAFLGYAAAAGIEGIIVLLSVEIGRAWKAKDKKRFVMLIVTLLFVSLVSVVANIVEGHKVKYGRPLTVENFKQLDGIDIAVGLLATALIPVVVLAISEIIAGMEQTPKQVAAPAQPAQAEVPAQPAKGTPAPSEELCVYARKGNCSEDVTICDCGTLVCKKHFAAHVRYQHEKVTE